MRLIPMIAVADVAKTSKILQKLFGWSSAHGGVEFDDLIDKDGKSVLWLHDLDTEHHPRFRSAQTANRGVGSTFYVVVEDISQTFELCKRAKLEIVEDLFFNENAQFREFTCKLSDGYQFTACEKGPYINL